MSSIAWTSSNCSAAAISSRKMSFCSSSSTNVSILLRNVALASSNLSKDKPLASAKISTISSAVPASATLSLNVCLSSSDKSIKLSISDNASSFCFSNNDCFSPGVNSWIRSLLSIVSWDDSDSVWSGNVIVAVPLSDISTLVPERKLLVSSIAFLMIFFSSKLRLAPKSCTLVFSAGIDISVLSGTADNFWRFINILKKLDCKFCLISLLKTLLQALLWYISISDHNLVNLLWAFPVTKIWSLSNLGNWL